MRIRKGGSGDIVFTRQMLFEAFFWDPGMPRPGMEAFFKKSGLDELLEGWGRDGDCLLIAEKDRAPIGAAWYRLWTDSRHFYGYIGPDIPELGIGVCREHRSKGTGRRLLNALLSVARQNGFKALSLSVDPANFARKLYETTGFKKVGESGTSWTYLLDL